MRRPAEHTPQTRRSAELEYEKFLEKSLARGTSWACVRLLEWHGSVLRRFFTTVAALVKGVVTLLFRRHEPQRALEPGDLAPLFSLLGSDGRTYRLADYVTAATGKPSNGGPIAVVLAWFPKAFTAG